MIGRLNHVGVATPSIADSARLYRDMFGAGVGEPFDLPAQGVRVAFVTLPEGEIELLEPLGADSPVHAFLQRNPKGGQHHLCFEVDDLLAARDTLVGRGLTVIGASEPRIGAHGAPVLFFHPRDTGGVLIELMQTPSDGAYGHEEPAP